MQLFLPTVALLPTLLSDALSVLAATVISFVVILLVSSYYRFQHIVERAENTNPEEMGTTPIDILRVQLARYLAGCSRRNTSFSLSLIRVDNPAYEVRMDLPVIAAVKQSARREDIVGVFDERTVALFTEAEPEDAEGILARIVEMTCNACPGLSADQVRVGIASYPEHALSGKELLHIALESLGKADMEHPVVMPELDADDEEEEVEPGEEAEEAEKNDLHEIREKRSRGWKDRHKAAMLDPLTGVLKPSAVSTYMQRMMNDLRQKKKKATLFCIGVNNMEYIARVHGEDVADDVLAGISEILQKNVRADDLIGRHEKYAFLILVQSGLENAETIGKRISTLVQRTAIPVDGKKIKTTITLGVAAYPEHGRNLHHLYRGGQKVLDYHRQNDIRAYAVYDPKVHDSTPSKPLRSIKSVQA